MKQALLVGSFVIGLANVAAAQGSEVYTRWGDTGSHFELSADTQLFTYEATVEGSTLSSVATLEVYHNGVLKCVQTQLGSPLSTLEVKTLIDMSCWGLRAGDTVTFRLKVSELATGRILALHSLTGEVALPMPKTE